mgnify:CR=1 FL=1
MEIVLIRHGKPEIDASGKLSASDFGKWLDKYDQAGIDVDHNPTIEAFKMTNRCSYIVCSTLPRSIESAKALNIDTPDMISHLFRECEMPYANWNYPILSIKSWAILFRILQLTGYSANAESYTAIKERTAQCANKLIELSREHESVLFVGHGALLWFIHKKLIRMGWSGPKKSVREHWDFGGYTQ